MLCYYGDDFTGSTDSMEALTLNGIRTVLFLDVPDPQTFAARFPGVQAFGVAGISRSLSPSEMEAELRPVFNRLALFRTPITHYKMCSTFDSSPKVGSIGKALALGCEAIPSGRYVPMVIGAPVLKRYTLFGNHFATIGDTTYRLDRHPIMAQHPITQMDEADLLKHLGKQSDKKSALVDILTLQNPIDEVLELIERMVRDGVEIVLFDVLDEERLAKVGDIIWRLAQQAPLFTVGSSGIEYALAAYWQSQGIASREQVNLPVPGQVKALLALSGSCSIVTRDQIAYALEHGFHGLRANVVELMNPAGAEQERKRLFDKASQIMIAGESVLIYSALGPEDHTIREAQSYLQTLGFNLAETSRLLGTQFGMLCRELVEALELKRVLVAGGDTSGYVTKELGVFALETILPITPGAPLCKGFSDNPMFDGIELSLKGGQLGKANYMLDVLHVGRS